MKRYDYIFLSFILFTSSRLLGQGMSGTWAGTLGSPANSAISLQSAILWKVSGQQINGELQIRAGERVDQYQLQGTITNTKAKGTATYPVDGSIFQFETTLLNGQLLVKLGQNGNVTMSGTLTRANVGEKPGETRVAPSNSTASTDGLYRDPALVGAWQTSSNYGGGGTDGGFYGSTSSIMILKADGTFGNGGSSGYASGAGVSVQSSGKGNSILYAQLAAVGARWFTKGNLFCVRLRVNGQMQDVPSAKYYVENGKLLITELKSSRKTLYYKTN